MDNAEKVSTLSTQDTGRRQTKQKNNTENYKDQQHGPSERRGVNKDAREGQAIPVSYKKSAMLLI